MRSMRVDQSFSPALVAAEVPQPSPGDGEVLIRVCAAGVTPTELQWYPTTHTKAGEARTGAIPGHEFSGVVAGLGANVAGLALGDLVYGMNDWFAEGATAEFCTARPEAIAPKPVSLTHEEAATVPIGALTAWQGLVDRAKIRPGERVLIQGGAGAVGMFAVQLAHFCEARVIATASAGKLDFVRQLGADEAVDYRSGNLERQIGQVDVVFDTVGGETLDRSWALLKPGGRAVAIAADSENSADPRIKEAFFIVEPRRDQLVHIGRLFDQGKLKAFVKATVPLADAGAAYNGTAAGPLPWGKVVILVGEG